MKNLFALLFIFTCFPLLAQDTIVTPAPEVKPKTNTGSTNITSSNRDRLIFEVGHDNWLHHIEDLEVKWYSRSFNFYAMYDLLIGRSPFSFAPGFGISTSNVFHNYDLRLANDSTLTPRLTPLTEEYKKNKLTLAYVELPVELRVRTNPNSKGNSFKVAAGFKIGYMVNSHVKLKQEFDGVSKIFKEKNIQELNKLRYGPTFRIGYSSFNLFAFYSLVSLLDEGTGKELRPVTIGFSFNTL